MASDGGSYGMAFLLVIIAGMCAPLGACVVLFMNTTKSHMLAACIALAGGVMIFVSLTEVLTGSIDDLRAGGLSEAISQLVGFVGFFCGVGVCYLLDSLTRGIVYLAMKGQTQCDPASEVENGGNLGKVTAMDGNEAAEVRQVAMVNTSCAAPQCLIEYSTSQIRHSDDAYTLIKTSIVVGVALGLHNFPEGLATFVGYMADAKLGVTIAISIALHNIPEGIAIGVPVYYATGSKLKAIGWTAVSGAAEPLGALLGLAIHSSGELHFIGYGITMSIVAGIMAAVAIGELIPRSMQYDQSHVWAKAGVFTGMAIMAISVVMLTAWG